MVALSTEQLRAAAIMEGYRAIIPFDTELPDDWADLLDQLNGQGHCLEQLTVASRSIR